MSFSDESSVNKADFDDSEDDIGSLLADDDDDIFSKKKFSKSPKKPLDSVVSPSKAPSDHSSKKTNAFEIDNISDAPKFGLVKSSPKRSISRNKSKELYDEKDQGVLDDLKFDISSASKEKHSPIKSKESTFDEEEDYLRSLKTNELSFVSTKNFSDDNFSKANVFRDQDDDILKDLESKGPAASNTGKRKSSSFLDDFLSKQSPKHTEQTSSDLETVRTVSREKSKDLEEEEDILGSYIPSATRKQSQGIFEETTSSSSRRGSLFKQVSFKEDSQVSPVRKASSIIAATTEPFKSKIPEPKSLVSSKKEKNVNKATFEAKSDKSSPKRSEKMKSKEDETDWLSFFKESPKKSSKPSESLTKDVAQKSEFFESAPKLNSRRRSSGAEWLGLNESKSEIKESIIKEMPTEETDWQISGDFSKPPRPKTTGDISARPRQKRNLNPSVETNWLHDDFEKDTGRNDLFTKDNADEKPVIFQGTPSIPIYSEKSSINDVISNKADQFSRIAKKEELNLQASGFKEVHNSRHEYMAPKMTNTPQQMLPSNMKISQESMSPNPLAVPIDSYQYFQAKLAECMLEKDQLAKSCENLKLTYEEKIKAIESVHKNQLLSMDDLSKIKENSLKTEYETKLQASEEKVKLLEAEKMQFEKSYKSKFEAYEEQHKKEMLRLKDLHSQSLEIMKQDHEDALMRLKRLKDQEVEAVLSTQSHSRSLQNLSDQLEARAAELASLQVKIEGKSQAMLLEKQALLESKEKELKALQSRLHKQLEDGEEEKIRLQQLVLRLESRLQKNTIEGEEDRWEVQQLKAKLNIQQKHMEEEYKLHQHQYEKEKEKLRISQDSLLHEQKTVLLQLAQERQQLTQEKIELASLNKKQKEDEAKLNVRKLKEESMIETQKRALQQEESKLYFEKEQVRQTSQQLEREQEQLLRERQQLNDEREKLNNLQATIRKKTQDLEEMTLRMAEEKEQCRLERETAERIKTEHQSRLQHYAQQMAMIMDKERQILMEKEKLTEEKIELENKKNSMLCNKCKISAELPVSSPYNPVNPVNALGPIVQTTQAPLLNGMSNNPQLFGRDPSLVVWYVNAQRDQDFLQHELAFIESLKSKNKKG
ncbi:fas-binding factor 1-like [Uloborus diversus]|uniref:fas-binding factor 1-like n=1 Tax=Uloborus diversus TaxID=327109 RepID=UPI002409F096|nr:fas-binding factor 1-like [Uloborus diversus]